MGIATAASVFLVCVAWQGEEDGQPVGRRPGPDSGAAEHE